MADTIVGIGINDQGVGIKIRDRLVIATGGSGEEQRGPG